MITTDLKKTYQQLYTATAEPALVEAPPLPFLMIDGTGDPSGPEYAEAVESLYTVAYGIRFALKGAGIVKYPVMPLQGLWCTDPERGYGHGLDRSKWEWTMMILQPSQADPDTVAEVQAKAAKKKPRLPVSQVRLDRLEEGRCVQALHIGPYRTEEATTGRMGEFMTANGLRINGTHHEIYLSNPQRTAEDKLKTIIRYPVAAM